MVGFLFERTRNFLPQEMGQVELTRLDEALLCGGRRAEGGSQVARTGPPPLGAVTCSTSSREAWGMGGQCSWLSGG